METYQTSVKCSNCKATNWITDIEKGTSVEAYCFNDNKICVICGCALYNQKED